MKTRDRRKIMKERSRVKTPEELVKMEQLLAAIRHRYDAAIDGDQQKGDTANGPM